MSVLIIGIDGIPLRQILKKPYKQIDVRCVYEWYGEICDEYIGSCAWDGANLVPLDGDDYDLDDLYFKWEESLAPDGSVVLTVWEKGEIKNE